jgi:hypothetical protein
VLTSCGTAGTASAKLNSSERLAQQQSQIALLTRQKPGLADVRVHLSVLCRDAFASMTEPKQTAFCQCGSTTTLFLWSQSEQMTGVLNEYLGAPSQDKLAALGNYQGPELYEPFCSQAVGN